MTPTGEMWIAEFDWRSDGGPDLVGPFKSRDAVYQWLDTVDCDYNGAGARRVARPA